MGEFAAGDELLNLLAQVRKQLINGNYRALHAVWVKYGNDEDGNDTPPVPPDQKAGKEIVDRFFALLEQC